MTDDTAPVFELPVAITEADARANALGDVAAGYARDRGTDTLEFAEANAQYERAQEEVDLTRARLGFCIGTGCANRAWALIGSKLCGSCFGADSEEGWA